MEEETAYMVKDSGRKYALNKRRKTVDYYPLGKK
jgi:hypothetical protein